MVRKVLRDGSFEKAEMDEGVKPWVEALEKASTELEATLKGAVKQVPKTKKPPSGLETEGNDALEMCISLFIFQKLLARGMQLFKSRSVEGSQLSHDTQCYSLLGTTTPTQTP